MGIARFADLFHEGRRAGVRDSGSGILTWTAFTDLIFN